MSSKSVHVFLAVCIYFQVLDFRPAYAEQCVNQGLFTWLLRRATQRGPLDANKMFASELLALLLQSSDSAKKKLTDKIDGFDLLLRVCAHLLESLT